MSPVAPLGALLLCLRFLSALSVGTTQVEAERRPYISGCVSSNMETFLCRWNVGTFQNLSEPGALRFFYKNKKFFLDSTADWRDCPHYSAEPPNQCFFNRNHTTVWTSYSVQLRSADPDQLYDQRVFAVQDIVEPDPPLGLNWTMLNMSLTGTHYDIMVSWKPPPSADVETGWMRLEYQVQHRDAASNLWKTVDNVMSTHRSLFGLEVNVKHEVRVRCRMLGSINFGEFGDSVFVHMSGIVYPFPLMALLIFGALCLVAVLMLVLISQQEKLMFILLPPVPGPKIRGINPELLKSGKLRELTSILGGPPDLRPELYNSDPWVEFIDLDIEEQTDRLTELDTDCLMERSLSSHCSPLSVGFRDDDSGRASCCDPDLPAEPELLQPLASNPAPGKEAASGSEAPPPPAEAPPPADRVAMYTQVSEVRSSGNVLLTGEEPTEQSPSERDTLVVEKKKDLQLLVLDPPGDYTSEEPGPAPTPAGPGEPGQAGGGRSGSPSSAYCGSPPPPSAPVYTVVEGVNRHNGLLLTPNSTPVPPLIMPKAMPTPDGYLTPDLLGSVTP